MSTLTVMPNSMTEEEREAKLQSWRQEMMAMYDMVDSVEHEEPEEPVEMYQIEKDITEMIDRLTDEINNDKRKRDDECNDDTPTKKQKIKAPQSRWFDVSPVGLSAYHEKGTPEYVSTTEYGDIKSIFVRNAHTTVAFVAGIITDKGTYVRYKPTFNWFETTDDTFPNNWAEIADICRIKPNSRTLVSGDHAIDLGFVDDDGTRSYMSRDEVMVVLDKVTDYM